MNFEKSIRYRIPLYQGKHQKYSRVIFDLVLHTRYNSSSTYEYSCNNDNTKLCERGNTQQVLKFQIPSFTRRGLEERGCSQRQKLYTSSTFVGLSGNVIIAWLLISVSHHSLYFRTECICTRKNTRKISYENLRATNRQYKPRARARRQPLVTHMTSSRTRVVSYVAGSFTQSLR